MAQNTYWWPSCTTGELPIRLSHWEEFFSYRLPKDLGVRIWGIMMFDLSIDPLTNAAIEW
jgi:hypothetical protein